MKQLLCISLCIFASIILCGCGVNETSPASPIDVSEHIIIVTEGSNGNGSAAVEVDMETLRAKLKKNMGNEKADTTPFLSSMTVHLTPSDGLSNGDEITICVSYNQSIAQKMGVTFSNTNFCHTVENLDTTEFIDPFEGVTLSYKGSSPCTMIQINYQGKFLDASCFQVTNVKGEDTTFFSIGDRFQVRVCLTEEELAERGCSLTKKEQEYTLASKDVTSYAKSVSEIKQETLERIQNECEQQLKQQFGATFLSVTYKGCQMVYLKDVNQYAQTVGYTDGFPESVNKLHMVYEILFQKDDKEHRWFTCLLVENILCNEFSQTFRLIEQDYTNGDYSYVTLNGVKRMLSNVSEWYQISYSVELQ